MKKITKKFFYSLDIGSKKMTLAAAGIQRNGEFGHIFIETGHSKGIFKGVVNDLAALSDAMQQLLKKMEAKCNEKATQVALSINGHYINARHSSAAIALAERGTRSITRRDIEKLGLQARTLGLELNEYLLHEYPQRYAIDRQNTTLVPLGLHGRKLEMDLLLICADMGYLQNITKAVEQIGLDVVQLVFSGIAASEAVLSETEKEKGVVLVDIGDSLTNVIIFKDGVPRCVHGFSFGGRNLTEIISNYFKIPYELADGIKESSMEIDSELPETEEVMIKMEDIYRPIKKKELLSITGPEIDKFIATLRSVIFNCGLDGVTGMSVVATGGLSSLEGLLEKMERDLGLSVKLGLTKNLQDASASQGPAVAAAIGLLCRQRDQYCKNALLISSSGKNKVSKVVDYFVNLYQDYF